MTKDDNIHKGIITFLMQYAAFRKWYFGIAQVGAKNVSLVPIPNDRYVEQWIGGGGVCEYQFAVGVFQNSAQQPYVEDKQTESVDSVFDVQDLMQWIEAQNEARILPELGDGLLADEIRVLQTAPGVTGETDKIQKWLFSGSLRYYELKE